MKTFKTYELIPLGFDGGTDETDDLIKWVVASTPQIAMRYAECQGLVLQCYPRVIFDGRVLTAEDGVDAVLE